MYGPMKKYLRDTRTVKEEIITDEEKIVNDSKIRRWEFHTDEKQ